MNNAIEESNKFCVDLHEYLRRKEQSTGKKDYFIHLTAWVLHFLRHEEALPYSWIKLSIGKDLLKANFEQKLLVPLQESNTEGNELVAANRLFVQKDLWWKRSLWREQKASVDYRKDAEAASKEVNEWVEQKTKSTKGVFNEQNRLSQFGERYLFQMILASQVWQIYEQTEISLFRQVLRFKWRWCNWNGGFKLTRRTP